MELVRVVTSKIAVYYFVSKSYKRFKRFVYAAEQWLMLYEFSCLSTPCIDPALKQCK